MSIDEDSTIELKAVYYLMSRTSGDIISKDLSNLLWKLNLKGLSTFDLSDDDIKEIDEMIREEIDAENDIENIDNMKHVPLRQNEMDF